MPTTTFLSSPGDFEQAFDQCTQEYSTLQMAVAWIGDPANIVPFTYLHRIPTIDALIGVGFDQSHPAGLALLMEMASLRIAVDEPLFHPKLYLFTRGNRRAAIIGSSNLTYHGFTENVELNLLVEGLASDTVFVSMQRTLRQWKGPKHSFVPTEDWLREYEKRYRLRRERLKKAGVDDEAEDDNTASASSAWLATARWPVYTQEIIDALRQARPDFHDLLADRIRHLGYVHRELAIPWQTAYFADPEKRRLPGGMKPYGWLGHVAASRTFRHLLANGTTRQHQIIVSNINAIAALDHPLPWNTLRGHLRHLTALGQTMKVWSRLLALMRPDLYCTISSRSVQQNLAALLGLPQRSFQQPDGYIHLLQLLHASPWFRGPKPSNPTGRDIWKRRVALMDVIFHDE